EASSDDATTTTDSDTSAPADAPSVAPAAQPTSVPSTPAPAAPVVANRQPYEPPAVSPAPQVIVRRPLTVVPIAPPRPTTGFVPYGYPRVNPYAVPQRQQARPYYQPRPYGMHPMGQPHRGR